LQVTTITENDQFLLVGCDGLFDVFSGEDIVKFVKSNLEEHGDAQKCCQVRPAALRGVVVL
jgi:protein phosphatase 2C family protein 2/3